MTKRFSRQLHLPLTFDLLRHRPIEFDPKRLGHFPLAVSELDEPLLELLQQRGIEVTHAEIFYTPPHAHLAIHVDGDHLSQICKLNWVYGGKGSRMMWWEAKDPRALQLGTTVVNTRYLYADQGACRLLESAVLGGDQPTLVNVGQLHSVINSGPEPRWCFSLVLSRQGQLMSFQEAAAVLAG